MKECDCSELPFEPPSGCSNKCCGRVLSTAAREELIAVFDMGMPLAQRIADINIEHQLFTFDDYKKHLEADEITALESFFSNLAGNIKAKNWLKKNMKKPEIIYANG